MCDRISSTVFPSHTSTRVRNFGLKDATNCFLPNFVAIAAPNLKNRKFIELKLSKNSTPFSPEGYGENPDKMKNFVGRNGTNKELDRSSFEEFLDLKSDNFDGVKLVKDEDLAKIEAEDSELRKKSSAVVRSGRQMMRRSNVIAKQVISISSALSLGFVSQLWVDTKSWTVVVFEVRPNLLSGEFDRFLLEDITQVGDVILVKDEAVMEDELRLVGLETLVGCTVITQSQRNIGKVRGFTFNINSGAVESLELDSFGISIIPSSLVSTYSLFVEDVMEVLPNRVVVHEAAASHIQRLTKGLWDAQNAAYSINEVEEYTDIEEQHPRPDYSRKRPKKPSRRKLRPKIRETRDDWELPMDYL